MRERARLRRETFFILATIITLLSLFVGYPSAYAATADTPIRLLSELKVGEGTFLKQYEKGIQGKISKVYVTQIDLSNPYVKIAPIYGKAGKMDKQPINKMADEQGAVVAINANFFHLTQRPAPFAMEYKDGELITSQSVLQDWQVFAITQDQTALIGTFGFEGQVTAVDGSVFPIFNLNKELHNTHAGDSHMNRLNLYNSRWGGNSIGAIAGRSGVVEVVIQNGIVTDFRIDQPGVPIPENGYVLMGMGTAAQYLKEHVKIGDPLQISYRVTPDAPGIQQAIGAHALLVDQGKPVTISPKTYFDGMNTARARSGVGISQDGKTVYLVVVEKSASSQGVTLDGFANILSELGIWRAANLDGGGSSTLVSRMPADATVTLINMPEGGSVRSVPDGIGVFNLAPPGKLAGIVLDKTANLLIGSKVTFPIKGYDEHILPYNLSQASVTWSSKDPKIGDFIDGSFVAKASGSTEVRASSQGIASNAMTVNVFSGKDLAAVEVSPSEIAVRNNDRLTLNITAKTKNGLSFKVSADNVIWTVEGVNGTMNGLEYQAGDTGGTGVLKGVIDGFTFTVPIRQGEFVSTFNTLDYLTNYAHSHYPDKTVPGSFARVDISSGEPVYRGVASMKLTYNFLPNTFDGEGKSADPVEAAYGDMNDPNLTFPAGSLGFGVWVYGDNSNYTLKSQIKDKNGKVTNVVLADRINWTGWKYVEARFTSAIAQPASIMSLYVVDTPNVNDANRPLSGSIYFDEIVVLRPYDASVLEGSKTVKPNEKDPKTDLQYKLGQLTLRIPADGMGKWTSEYSVSALPVGKLDKEITWVYPFAYGFQLNGTKKENATASTFPIYLKNNGESIGLLQWSEEEKQWKEIRGFPTWQGEWRFDLTKGGIYVPFKKTNAVSFKDIYTYWAKESIARMAEIGIIKGVTEQQYKPHDSLSRGEFATLLYRVIEREQPDLARQLIEKNQLSFADPIPDWAQTGALAAVNLGVMQGVGENKFGSTILLTREQLATIIARSVAQLQLELPAPVNKGEIADAKAVSSWAKEGVKLSVEQNLFPLSNNKFNPRQNVTRGEAAYAIAKIYEWMGNKGK